MIGAVEVALMFLRSRRSIGVAWLIGAAALGCTDLGDVPENVCGNGVVEPANLEVCDAGPDAETVFETPDGPLSVRCGQIGREACHWTCTSDGRCPPGLGCGADNVCRAPSGTLSLVYGPISSGATALKTGDLDGDGHGDVLAVEPGEHRIFHFGERGILSDEVRLPLLSETPALGRLGPLVASNVDPDEPNLSLDRTDDLVLTSALGFSVLLANEDHSYEAKAYSSVNLDAPGSADPYKAVELRPFAANALQDAANTGDETIAFARFAIKVGDVYTPSPAGSLFRFGGDGVFVLQQAITELFPSDPKNPGILPSRLSGPPLAANLDPTTPCDEIAFPQEGSQEISIWATCVPTGDGGFTWAAPDAPRLATILLPAGCTLTGPIFAFDANMDGAKDLVMTCETATGTFLRVAWSDGDGGFQALGPAPGLFETDILTPLDGQVLLAAGDLNGDQQMDVVLSLGVEFGYLSGPPEGPLTLVDKFGSSRAWTEAHIEDFNQNGYMDVIGVARGERDIDFLNGSPSSEYNLFPLNTEGRVTQTAVGDFDGDLLPDLAIAESIPSAVSPSNESLNDRLSVAFGQASGGLEPAKRMADFSKISGLGAAQVHLFGADAVSDLGVVSVLPAQDPKLLDDVQFSVFPGTSSRVMLPPILLVESMVGGVQRPIVAAVAAVPEAGGQTKHNGIVVMASRVPPTLYKDTSPKILVQLSKGMFVWSFPGTGDADLPAASNLTPEQLPDGFFWAPFLDSLFQMVTLPGKESDSVLAVGPFLVFEDANTGAGMEAHTGIVEVNPNGKVGVGEHWLSAPNEIYTGLIAGALDDDPAPDLVAIRFTFEPKKVKNLIEAVAGIAPIEPDFTPTKGELVVFWNGVLGEGGQLSPQVIPTDAAALEATIFDADGDDSGAPELLVGTSTGPKLFDVDPASHEFTERALPVGLVDADDGPTDLAFGVLSVDFDGDGVKDLVTRSDVLSFYRMIPTDEVLVTEAASALTAQE